MAASWNFQPSQAWHLWLTWMCSSLRLGGNKWLLPPLRHGFLDYIQREVLFLMTKHYTGTQGCLKWPMIRESVLVGRLPESWSHTRKAWTQIQGFEGRGSSLLCPLMEKNNTLLPLPAITAHWLETTHTQDYDELGQKRVQWGALFFLCVFLYRCTSQHGNSTGFNSENTQLITKVKLPCEAPALWSASPMDSLASGWRESQHVTKTWRILAR